jgi:DNA-binding transcriptional LysR family regulator/uncharacterized membrane protein YtjA (UPF0391 family)
MDGKTPERTRRRRRLRDLETLIAVAQAGGMRKAAVDLHMSQPAASKAMRELEDTVGLKLLDRGRRGVSATAFGDALVRRSKGLVDDLQTALRELAWLADPEAGEARLGTIETLQAQLHRYPGMRFYFESAPSNELIGHLLPQRLVDVVIERPLSLPRAPDIEGEALFRDQLRIAVGPQHPLARRRRVTLADLLEDHWILSRTDVLLNSPVRQAFGLAGLPFPTRIVVTGSIPMRQTLLGNDRFVTCIPHSMLPFAQTRGCFHFLPIELQPWSTPTMVLKLRGRTLSPAVEVFLETLRTLSRTQLGEPGRGSARGSSAGTACGHSKALPGQFWRCPGHAAWGLVLHAGPGSSDSAVPIRAPTLAPTGPADPPPEHTMLHYALVFFVIAVIAALLGFGGIAAGAAGIAKLLALVFIVLALVSLAVDVLRGRR